MAHKRVSLSLPHALVDDLDYVSHRLGISRSSLVAQVLNDVLAPSVAMLRTIPENVAPTDEDVKRFRGASVKLIRERLDNLHELDRDLFSELAWDPAEGRD